MMFRGMKGKIAHHDATGSLFRLQQQYIMVLVVLTILIVCRVGRLVLWLLLLLFVLLCTTILLLTCRWSLFVWLFLGRQFHREGIPPTLHLDGFVLVFSSRRNRILSRNKFAKAIAQANIVGGTNHAALFEGSNVGKYFLQMKSRNVTPGRRKPNKDCIVRGFIPC